MKQKRNIRNDMEIVAAVLAAIYGVWRFCAFMPFAGGLIIGIPLCILSLSAILFQYYTAQYHTTHSAGKYSGHFSRYVLISGILVGYLVYYACSLFVLDILYLILRYGIQLNVPHWPCAVLGSAAALIVTIYGARHAQFIKLIPYRLHLYSGDYLHHMGMAPDQRRPGSPDESAHYRIERHQNSYRVVLLSDLHIGAVIGWRFIMRVRKIVNLTHADLIVITGDLLNKAKTEECVDLSKVEEELAQMKCADGVYAVTGNHDPAGCDPQFNRFLSASGIRLLDDASVDLGPVRLIGRAGNPAEIKTRRSMQELMADGNTITAAPGDNTGRNTNPYRNKPVIVLDHNPQGVEEAAAAGADLVLCGHTHRGQYFPVNVLTHFYYGGKLNHGYSRQGRTQVIVSSGTGFFQVPLRVGTDSEICCIDLKIDVK